MAQVLVHQAGQLPVKGVSAGSWKRGLENLLIALAYFLTAPLGQMLAIPPGNVTPVWIPSGIILAAALIRGRGVWPGIFLGAFAGNAWVYLDFSSIAMVTNALLSGVANGIGDALCVVVGATLIRRNAGTKHLFDTGKGVIVFIVCGALTAGVISASFGVTGLALGGFIPWSEYSKVWFTWSVGDVMGIMLLTPFILEWRAWRQNRLTFWQWLEVGAMMTVLAIITLFCMGVLAKVPSQVSVLVILPLLIPPAFRFHHGVTFLAVLLTGAIMIVSTSIGKGPFSGNGLNAGLIELQVFLGMIATTIYILKGVLTERRLAWKNLTETSTELDETRLSLVEAERMRTIGQIASGVAHEVKNPLAIISLGADFLTRKTDDSDSVSKKVLKEMQHAIERADSIVLGLLDFGAPKKLTLEEVPMEDLIREAKVLTDHALTKHQVELNAVFPENVPVLRVDRDKCVQVLVNLILNACHSIESHGEVRLVVRAEESVVELLIEDDGPGVPKEVLPRLFEPFFTTKNKEGTGLGLSVSRTIMRMHDGDLTAENRQEGGARFRMTWPLRCAT